MERRHNYHDVEFVLRNPFTMTIAGPSKCGKTTLVEKIIENANWFYSEKPNKFFYFYNEMKPIDKHSTIHQNVEEFFNGTPSMEWLKDIYYQYGENVTIIIDDQDLNLTKDIATIFNVGSHHMYANVIYITHNIFGKQKEARDMSLNCDYFVLCKQVRDQAQIRNFFTQNQPRKFKAALNAYNEATNAPYSYFWIDLHQETPDHLRFLSNVFSENGNPPHVFVL